MRINWDIKRSKCPTAFPFMVELQPAVLGRWRGGTGTISAQRREVGMAESTEGGSSACACCCHLAVEGGSAGQAGFVILVLVGKCPGHFHPILMPIRFLSRSWPWPCV